MPMPTPAQLVEAIQDHGVDFRPYPYSSRPWHEFTTAGDWNPIGIAHHHTTGSKAILTPGSDAQKAMLRLLRDGRAGLDGPLCQLAPVYAGEGKRVVYGIGWGNCNHAGLIARNVFDHLKAGTYSGQAPGPDAVDGNARLYGLEYLHPGDGTPWPDELLDAGHRTAAAICDAHGWAPDSWAGSNAEHREVTRRKADRSWSGWGDGMRRRIAKLAEADEAAEAEAATAWPRPAAVTTAIRELRRQAREFEERGMERRARAVRQEIRHLTNRWPDPTT